MFSIFLFLSEQVCKYYPWPFEYTLGLLLQNPANDILEKLRGSIAHCQKVWLPLQENGEKGKGLFI